MSQQNDIPWVTLASAARPRLVQRVRLVVTEGPDASLEKPFAEDRIRIGANEGNDFHLNDRRVSGYHCELRLDSDGCRLRDLGSRNGTYLGSTRLVEAFVEPGATFVVGSSHIRLESGGELVPVPRSSRDRLEGLVGRSGVMRELYARIERVAPSDVTVLISGETGTGKELVAEAMHRLSPRAGEPFVVFDCGAIPPSLVSAELFGHEKGAFTSAVTSREGAFVEADGGTLFLDEIGELQLETQAALLRVLEKREVRKLGGKGMRSVDVRMVAATNRDLPIEANRGRFRADLYYRLAGAELSVPPLRQRRDDIPLLIEHFMAHLSGGGAARMPDLAAPELRDYEWPGNVRELKNFVGRAALGEQVFTPARTRQRGGPGVPSTEPDGEDLFRCEISLDQPFKDAKGQLVDSFERRYATRILGRADAKVARAARLAGLDRASMQRLARLLGKDEEA